MDEIKKPLQQGVDPPVEDSINPSLSFTDIIKERAFIGDTPVETIYESIQKQFEDYINMEDNTNYVDVFYKQLMLSYDKVNNDDSEEHPTEIREVLNVIHQEFTDFMQELFSTRLTITIPELEGESILSEDLEFIIRRLYEFFILGARNNFKSVIATDVRSAIENIGDNDDEYFKKLQELMDRYSPLLTTMTPTTFLKYRGDQEVYDLFENGMVAGNFLRKYSPKLYQNDEFLVDLTNYITMIHQFKKDLVDSNTMEPNKNNIIKPNGV